MTEGLRIRIRHRFERFSLDFDLDNESGGVTALFGPSGAGKTSVINAVAGLMSPDDALISVGGRVLTDTARGVLLPPQSRRVGYVFQDARLFPHKNVRDNLLYPTRFHGTPAHLDDIVELLEIGALLDRYPRDLSGGEAQRVAIGRALMAKPDLLLMDEPLASLDQRRREEILPYLDDLMRATKAQMIYVSHSMAEVARLADVIVLMREGRIIRSGAAHDVLSDPAAVPDIGVREAGAVVTAKVTSRDAGDGLSALALSSGTLYLPQVAAADGTDMRLRILASDIILSKDKPDGLSALNILPAVVQSIQEGAGPGVAVALKSGSDRLVARITRRSARSLKLAAGIKCYAVIKSVSVAPSNIGRGHKQE
ncbi:MAG: molybdenum ABC transporter ATP-binding protein [Pseudomonadota bacterium]